VYERAISLSGLSKAYGLPGLRIGWLASHNGDLIKRACELKDYTTICSSAPSEILAIVALRNSAAIIRQQNVRLRRNLSVLDSFLDDYRTVFRWNRPLGGSVCFPRMLAVEDTAAFCAELKEKAGIMLVPSGQFQFGDHHVRIGFGRETLPSVLEHFAKYLDRRFR
jgi:aspartate/methionine/tyrosine aminotransferase